MKKPLGSLLVFFFVLAYGCIPIPERHVVVTPEPTVVSAPLLPADLLEEKIGFLSNILQKEDLTEKDRELASSLLEVYESIKTISVGDYEEAEYRKVVRALLHNLGVLDEYYFSKQQEITKDYSKSISLFTGKRKETQDAYVSGDSKGVINHCLELKAIFGPDAITPEIGSMFALSLAKEGMLTEAKSIIEGIVPELDASPDLNHLRGSIVELQLQLGERENAIQVYKRLTDTLHKQEAMIQKLSESIALTPRKAQDHEAPEPSQIVRITPVQPEREHGVMTQPEGATGQLIYDVEQLVREHRFGEAWDLLSFKKGTASSESELKTIDRALKSLERAQEQYLDETISMISEKKETLQMAHKFFEEEKYEQAISSLDTLSKREESHEVKELKEQAVERLINRERNRAAKIFLTAKRTHDPEKKEENLRSSYNILKSLIDKYPSSPLINKVKSHIEKVKKELEKLENKKDQT
jgi:thioredoxin-like negative regulator of GroEL